MFGITIESQKTNHIEKTSFKILSMRSVFLFSLPVLFIFVLCPSSNVLAQVYQDHFGTGNNVGVTISSSPVSGTNDVDHTLNGTGYFPGLEDASRFLGQASLGASYEEIQYVTQTGMEAWIEEQIAMSYSPYLPKYQTTYQEIVNMINLVHPGSTINRSRNFMSFIFYESALKDPDVLRNKVAFNLLQILVVSNASITLNNKGFGHSSYYNILYDGAFGNYRDLLTDVTLHLMMGSYLSHFKNKAGNPAQGTFADENYAREIMQLFSIGLWEMNLDGTYVLDANGEKIPTYDITDIQELAKVFTGLAGGAYDTVLFPNLIGVPLSYNYSLNKYDMTVPMVMFEDKHDTGTKIMIDGSIIPAGQPGMQDISDALDVLFNHQNVAPFMAIRLIQQMVKSNPTPAYIKRVATAFNNNGYGVRGDMGAVFKAILLDPEARDCNWISDEKNGRLKQPIERIVNLFRAFDIDSPSGKLWLTDGGLTNFLGQAFMASPSVFNFFSPFYAESDYVAPNDMVSPEFQILHAVTAIYALNLTEDAIKTYPFSNTTKVNTNNPKLTTNNSDRPFLDFTDEIATLQNNGVTALLDRLDILMCHGTLSNGSKAIIANTLQQLIAAGGFSDEDIVHEALYFVMASPDYCILE